MTNERTFGATFRLMIPAILIGGAATFCVMFITAIAVGKSPHEASVYGTSCGIAIMLTTSACIWMTYHLDRTLH